MTCASTRRAVLVLAIAGALLMVGRDARAAEPITVTAKLVEIPSSFPPDDLYDYAYVMRYVVVGGPWTSSPSSSRTTSRAAAIEDQGRDEGIRER